MKLQPIRTAFLIILTLLLSFTIAQTQYTSGKVLEKMDSGGYSYLQVKTGDRSIWLAAPLTDAKKGETIQFSQGMLMENFTSPSLNRTFPEIYFTGTVLRGDQAQGRTAKTFNHAETAGTRSTPVTADKINQVRPLKDGLSIRAIQAQKKKLAGSKIKLRGLVTKYNAEIMGKNWLHLRDASTGNDGNDLVATTAETFTVGDVVILEGTVTLDQNFGFGYSYELLLTEVTRIQEP